MKRLKCGIIGTGGIAKGKHLPLYAGEKDHVELYALCDTEPASMEAPARQYGITRLYRDYREMLALKELDFVCVCLPNHLHKRAAVDALLAGKHVHCEKPMAMNAVEAREMVRARDRSGKVLMLGLNNRFTRESQFTRRYVAGGGIGEVYRAECGWRRRYGLPAKAWFADKKLSGGGPFIDLGVHYLDLVLHFLGYPPVKTVSGSAFTRFGNTDLKKLYSYRPLIADFETMDVEDLACGFLRTSGGTAISFEFSWASNTEREHLYYELLGTKGGVRLDIDDRKELKVFGILNGELVNIQPDINPVLPVETESSHFVRCIREGRQPEMAPLEEGVRMMEIIDSFYLSAERGEEVRLDEGEGGRK